MISILAIMMGGDERAIRIARKLTFAVMWLSEWETHQLVRDTSQQLDALARRMRRAA